MGKRKAGPGGYPLASSSEDDEPQPETKKAKVAYVPLRVSALGKPGSSGFLFPKANTTGRSDRIGGAGDWIARLGLVGGSLASE